MFLTNSIKASAAHISFRGATGKQACRAINHPFISKFHIQMLEMSLWFENTWAVHTTSAASSGNCFRDEVPHPTLERLGILQVELVKRKVWASLQKLLTPWARTGNRAMCSPENSFYGVSLFRTIFSSKQIDKIIKMWITRSVTWKYVITWHKGEIEYLTCQCSVNDPDSRLD